MFDLRQPSSRQKLAVAWCVAFWLMSAGGSPNRLCAQTKVPELMEPVFWPQRIMYIPYQLNLKAAEAEKIDRVQLMISSSPSGDWRLLQSAKPNVQGFSYHAPEDGHYWFALQHRDSRGQTIGAQEVKAQLHIVVDTKSPQLEVTATCESRGELLVRYSALDANLEPKSLKIEARLADGPWIQLTAETPDVSQPDRLIGRARWQLQHSAGALEVRASIADRAGHRQERATEVTLVGPDLAQPAVVPAPRTMRDSSLPETPNAEDPFHKKLAAQAQDWPTSNELPRVDSAPVSADSSQFSAPPILNPYTNTGQGHSENKIRAQLAVDSTHGAADERSTREPTPEVRSANQLPAGGVNLTEPRSNEWTSSDGERRTTLYVNSRTFDIEYDLDFIGPWGVGRVELWGTTDGGATWRSFGVDPDMRSPLRANVPSAGVYGFRILVDSANGVGASPPHRGDTPELTVAVDLHQPRVELLKAQLDDGDRKDRLRLTWRAEDENLDPRPIGLFYSSSLNGPWSTIAVGLENTGEYVWRIERHVPERFYVRIEVSDMAGNVATYETPDPLVLNRPQPTGHLRSVRPVTGTPAVRDH